MEWDTVVSELLLVEVGSADKEKLPWGDFHRALKIIPSPKFWVPSWFGNVCGRFNFPLACSWRDCSHGMESFLLWECTEAEPVLTCFQVKHQGALIHPRQNLDDHTELLEWEVAFAPRGTGQRAWQ